MRPFILRSTLVIACGFAASLAWSATDGPADETTHRISGGAVAPTGKTPAVPDFETLNFRAAAACATCHSAVVSRDGDGPDSSTSPVMVDQWSASIMSYGSEDPFWQAKVKSEVLRAPLHRNLVEAKCAAFQNLKTPFFDAQGRIVGSDFPEQMPFSEWQRSNVASLEEPTGCQQCHMAVEDEGRLAVKPTWLEDRGRASHAFVSANTEILSLLAMETALQGGDPSPLLASVDAGRELLARAGELHLLGVSLDQGTLEFELLVDNSTGHKLPTAFPSRRVYLHTVVRDDSDEIVFESGAMMANGRIIGVDSDDDSSTYEPHHRIITTPDQVQVYEAILGSIDNDVTYTLLRAGRYLKDNRIVPAGFDPATVPEDIRPTGGCMDDPDFGAGHDKITYRIDDLGGSRYTVAVELRHQAIGYPYVMDLTEFSDDAVISRFLDLYAAVLPGSEVIAKLAFETGG